MMRVFPNREERAKSSSSRSHPDICLSIVVVLALSLVAFTFVRHLYQQQVAAQSGAASATFLTKEMMAVLQPSSEFFRQNSYAGSHVVGIAGLLLALWGAYNFYAARRRTAHVEQIIAERTSDLASTITALKTEARQHQLAKDELDRFFSCTLVGLCIAGTDGYFKRVNPAMSRILGYTEHELLAIPFLGLVHPDDVASTLREVQTLSEGKDTVGYENRYLCRDGRWAWIKWQSTACPAQQLIYAVAHDITEQKHEQEILFQSEQHYRTLFAEAPVAFIEQDLSSVVNYIQQLNIPVETDIHAYIREHPEVAAQCERRRRLVRTNLAALTLSGASDQEAFFSSLTTHDSLDSGQIWANVIDAIRRRTGKLAYESRIATLDGKWRDVICQWSVLQSSQDEWARVLWSLVDMTDHKEAEVQRLQAVALHVQIEAEHRVTESLKRSNESLQEFAVVASHDLQEPLRKIQAYSNQLTTKFSQQIGEQGGEYLQRIGSATERMRNMISDLLALGSVSTRVERFEPVDLEATAREVLSDLDVAIQRSQAEVEVGDLPRISADPTQIRQLLQNLLENALKFRKPNEPPRVSVKGRVLTASSEAVPPAGASGPFCEITVEDHGIGFDEECSEEIFRPFQRLHGRGEYEGNGIGLAICQKIVTRHHGAIVAEGHPNSGAKFTVTLPVAQSEPGMT